MRYLLLLVVMVQSVAFAQRKNVALVTIYIENRVNLDAFGKGAMFITGPDGDFMPDMQPMVKQLRDSLFKPAHSAFKLLPEKQVLNGKYKLYKPRYYDGFEPMQHAAPPGYKIIYFDDNEMAAQQLGRLIPEAGALLFVKLSFELRKGKTATDPAVMQAVATMETYTKLGKKVGNNMISASATGNPDETSPATITPEAGYLLCKKAFAELLGMLKDI
ncbi:MAG: hypothetical protein ACO1N9_04285 [Flavobacterium sp.]